MRQRALYGSRVNNMNPSIRPDINAVSVTGDAIFPAGIDLESIDGMKFASTLKLTDGIHDQVINNLRVTQSTETSVDMDWATNMEVGGDFGLGPVLGDNVLRSKGGYKHIKYRGTLHSRGQRNGDIELGDWFDQNYTISRTCDLTGILPHADGKGKVTVVIGWVMPFTTKLGDNCRVLWIQSIGLKLYVIAKFIIRFILRIPKGVKGPSWF